MSIKSIMRKRIKLFFASTIVIVLALVTTYFIFSKNRIEDNVLFNSNNLKVTRIGDKELEFGEVPMSVEEGLINSPVNRYKVANKTKTDLIYRIKITETSGNAEKEYIGKIVVAIGDDVKLLTDVLDGIVYEENLRSKSEDIIDLRIWLDKTRLDKNDEDLTLSLKVEFEEI